MTERKSLYDYKESEFPDLIRLILMEQVKLFALISADDQTFLLSENDKNESGQYEKYRSAKSGQYEICEIKQLISSLEQIHSSGFDPDPFVRPAPYEIELFKFISPDGDRCKVGSSIFPFKSMEIPFTRIIVQDNPAKSQISGYEINTPEYLAIHDVFGEFWANGKKGEKKTHVVDWIRNKYGFSRKTAEVIDTICRPENRRVGGNVKLKRVKPKKSSNNVV